MYKIKALAIAGCFVFLATQVLAKELDENKKEATKADLIIAACKEKAASLWSQGTPLAFEDGSNVYQECLKKSIASLTNAYFYAGEKKQQQFLQEIEETAKKYHSIANDIYLAHKNCAVPDSMQKKCGALDSVLSYGNVNKFYEDILKSLASVYSMQSDFKN